MGVIHFGSINKNVILPKFTNLVFANLNYFGIFAALKMSAFGMLIFC
jgi:hypothetical protein